MSAKASSKLVESREGMKRSLKMTLSLMFVDVEDDDDCIGFGKEDGKSPSKLEPKELRTLPPPPVPFGDILPRGEEDEGTFGPFALKRGGVSAPRFCRDGEGSSRLVNIKSIVLASCYR